MASIAKTFPSLKRLEHIPFSFAAELGSIAVFVHILAKAEHNQVKKDFKAMAAEQS
jgi:hypothetical protein